MSSTWGFYDLEGRYAEIQRPSDIQSPYIQGILRRAYAQKLPLTCACSVGERSAQLRVARVALKSSLTPVRVRIDLHAPTCVFAEFRRNGPVRTAPTIFGPQPEPATRSEEGQVRIRVADEYERFDEYARRALREGLEDAFVSANSGSAEFRCATTDEVFEATKAAIGRSAVTDGRSPYEVAADRNATLRIGIMMDPIIGFPGHRTRHLHAVNIFWWKGRSFYELQRCGADERAIEAAVRNVRAQIGAHRPPYFCLAVQNSKGQIERLALQQVVAAESYMLAVDSGFEASALGSRARSGAGIFKPLAGTDINAALRRIGLYFQHDWEYRPDALIFTRFPDGARIEALEIRGKPLGADPEYDQRLERYPAMVDRLVGSVAVRYRVDESMRPWRVSVGPEEWANVRLLLA